jgi:5-methylthioribose kinase
MPVKTNTVTPNTKDLDLAQIVKSYVSAIGIDMEIRVIGSAASTQFTRVAKA